MNRAERKTVERVVRAAIDDTATEVGPGDLTPLHLVPRTGTAARRCQAECGPGGRCLGRSPRSARRWPFWR